MLRIIVGTEVDHRIELHLAGRIGTDEVNLLDGEIRRLQHDGRLLVLDLEGIQYIDPPGLDLLRHWIGDAMQLRGGSAFICRVLATDGLPHVDPL